jgi:hypothetical protein
VLATVVLSRISLVSSFALEREPDLIGAPGNGQWDLHPSEFHRGRAGDGHLKRGGSAELRLLRTRHNNPSILPCRAGADPHSTSPSRTRNPGRCDPPDQVPPPRQRGSGRDRGGDQSARAVGRQLQRASGRDHGVGPEVGRGSHLRPWDGHRSPPSTLARYGTFSVRDKC